MKKNLRPHYIGKVIKHCLSHPVKAFSQFELCLLWDGIIILNYLYHVTYYILYLLYVICYIHAYTHVHSINYFYIIYDIQFFVSLKWCKKLKIFMFQVKWITLWSLLLWLAYCSYNPNWCSFFFQYSCLLGVLSNWQQT